MAGKNSTTDSTANPGRAGGPATARWDDEAHKSLCGAVLDGMEAGSLSFRSQAGAITQSMADRGHTFTWEGIR